MTEAVAKRTGETVSDRAEPAVTHVASPVATFAGRALGSGIQLSVTLLDDRPDSADGVGGAGDPTGVAAWAEVLDELAQVDAALSRFRDDSELTELNRRAGSGGSVAVSSRLRVALAICRRAQRVTDGRFDAGMLDVLERIGEHGATLAASSAATSTRARPRAEPAAAARAVVPVPPRPVDLGGIGKGLALRWAAARAIRCVPPGAGILLDAGGDLIATGRAPAGGWLVGIEDPVAADPGTSEPLAVVALDRTAIATSSVRVRRWTAPDGSAVHHLLDPRTRQPAQTGLIAVTVAASDPAWAEIWSKALFLAGSRAIGEEARSRGLAAWWVDDRGRIGMTPAARIRTAWAAETRLG